MGWCSDVWLEERAFWVKDETKVMSCNIEQFVFSRLGTVSTYLEVDLLSVFHIGASVRNRLITQRLYRYLITVGGSLGGVETG